MLMAVMMPRERWTDERLDDLNRKVDDGFADIRAEMRERFDRMEARMEKQTGEMNERFDQVNERFDRMQHTLFAGAIALSVALIGCCATLAGIALF
jgi:chromosome segregation ATPase